MILIIDNYDSFTYNLVQYLGEMDEIMVRRNDKISISEIEKLKPDYLVISPGPGRPENAGVSMEAIKHFKNRIPILGVCLGHQCIGSVFGASIIKASEIFHGKTSLVYREDIDVPIFRGIKKPFLATRYHSLIIDPETITQDLLVLAKTKFDVIMAVKYRCYPVYGLQFHPESILTETGKLILKNFLSVGRKEYV